MVQIVGLADARGRRGRIYVELDDGTGFTLVGIIGISLSVGQELTTEELQDLKQRNTQEDAYERVLNYLSYRPRSEAEVRHYLAQKGAEQASDEVIARLKQSGLIDDRDFAQYWVENRDTFRPRGKWALQAELRRAGVAKDVIEEAVSSIDDAESALRAGRRKAEQLRTQDLQTFRKRLLSFLQRRGYNYGIADRTARELWRQLQAEAPDEIGN